MPFGPSVGMLSCPAKKYCSSLCQQGIKLHLFFNRNKALILRAIHAENQGSSHRDQRSISPVGPLTLAMGPAHCTVGKGHRAVEDQGPAQCLTRPKVGGGVDDQTHKDVSDAVNRHQAVDHAVKCCIGGWLECEKGEAMVWARDSIDAEADRYGCNRCCDKMKNR